MDEALRAKVLGRTLPRKELAIPEWDCTLVVCGLTGNQRDELEAVFLAQGRNMIGVRAKVAAMVCRGADGDLLFTDADVPALGAQSGAALEAIFNAALELSGMHAGAAKKNLNSEQSGDSGTG